MRAPRRLLGWVFFVWAVLAIGPVALAREVPVRAGAADDLARLTPGFTLPTAHAEAAEAEPLGPEPNEPGLACGSAAAVRPSSLRASLTRASARPAFAADILLLIQRQNE